MDVFFCCNKLFSIRSMQVHITQADDNGDAGGDCELTMGWCGVMILMTCLNEHQECDDT